MLCKDNMARLDYKSKKNNTKHIFPHFFFIEQKKTTYYEMHECNAMQILKAKGNQNSKERNGHKEY